MRELRETLKKEVQTSARYMEYAKSGPFGAVVRSGRSDDGGFNLRSEPQSWTALFQDSCVCLPLRDKSNFAP